MLGCKLGHKEDGAVSLCKQAIQDLQWRQQKETVCGNSTDWKPHSNFHGKLSLALFYSEVLKTDIPQCRHSSKTNFFTLGQSSMRVVLCLILISNSHWKLPHIKTDNWKLKYNFCTNRMYFWLSSCMFDFSGPGIVFSYWVNWKILIFPLKCFALVHKQYFQPLWAQILYCTWLSVYRKPLKDKIPFYGGHFVRSEGCVSYRVLLFV